MKKQTAVEWLVDELRNQIAQGTLDAIAISRLKMQAKAMEREQIEQVFYLENVKWVAKTDDNGRLGLTNEIKYPDAEAYYNDTYK